jgi:N-formylglutamate deformylase
MGRVALNDPFVGGFTIRSHYRQKRIPWVQVEINRGVYENPPGNLAELRERIRRVLAQFCREMSL